MAKSETNEVAKKANTDVGVALNFEEAGSTGFDEMNQDDLALPFVRILQPGSPQIGNLDGATPGMFYNTVSDELTAGSEGIAVVACAYERKYTEWEERGTGKNAPVNIFNSTSDILTKTHKKPSSNKDWLDNGNYVEQNANYYVMVLDKEGFPTPALIIMKSTQLKKARKWNSMMQSVKATGKNGMFTPPMFSQVYRLTSVSEKNDYGNWFGFEVSHMGAIENASLYEKTSAFAKSVKAGEVTVKTENEEEAKEEEKDHNIF